MLFSDFLQKIAIAPSSWAGVAMITIIMLLIGLAAHRIGMTVLTRLARTRAIPSIMLRAIHSPTRYLLVLCALQMAWQEVPPKLSLIVWLRDKSGFALIGVLSWFGMRMVMAAGETITYLHPIDVSGNLIAGLQIALTQPIRLDDVVIVAEEWGRIEEIHSSYVVVRLWDQRRLIVPLQWFIENPFQNWTRTNAQIIGSIFLWVDYRLPLEPLRDELVRLCNAAPEWDHRAQVLQVTDTSERAMQLRVLVSSANSALNWDLRCK